VSISEKSSIGRWRLKRTQRLGLVSSFLLGLYGTAVGDPGLAHLAAVPTLRELGLSGTRVSDAGLAKLRPLGRLEVLDLRHGGITDRGAEALAVLEHSSDQPVSLLRGVRGYTYAKCGRRARALAELDHLRTQASDGKYVSHYGLAVILAGLGDKEQAVTELEKAYTERAPGLLLTQA